MNNDDQAATVEYPRLDPKARLNGFGPGRTTTQVAIAVIICLVVAAILYPVFAQAKLPSGKPPVCVTNVKRMMLACNMYSADFDNTLPDGAAWMDRITPYTNNLMYTNNEAILHDKTGGVAGSDFGYAFRGSASRLNVNRVPRPTEFVLVFDSTLLQRNATSDLSTMPRPGRHEGRDTVGFVDGHAKQVVVAKGRKVHDNTILN